MNVTIDKMFLNMKILIFLMLSLSIISSCESSNRNKKQSKDEDFDSFYLKFNRDLNFQNSRIKYPLKGKNYSSENKNPDSDYYFNVH